MAKEMIPSTKGVLPDMPKVAQVNSNAGPNASGMVLPPDGRGSSTTNPRSRRDRWLDA